VDNLPANPHDSLITFAYRLTTTGYHTFTFITIRMIGGCRDSVKKTNYVIVSKPDANFGASPLLGCIPFPVTFIDSSLFTPGTGGGTRTWTFGDGGTLTNSTSSASHTYTTPGIFTARLVVKDFNGCADSMTRVSYIQARHPIASFTASRTSACRGDLIGFSNISVGATALTFYWTFGDGDTSTLQYPTHAYAASGVYTVRLVVRDNTGCTDTMTRASYISITKPLAAFTLDDSVAVCPPLVVQFTNNSVGGVSYAWTFGNTNSAVIPNPTASYGASGVYNIRLVVTNAAGCTDTANASVRVLGYAGAFAYPVQSGCAPLTVMFSATVTNAANLVWDFSDGVTVTGAGSPVSHTYLTPGRYVPKLIFSDSLGCTASSTGLDTIKVDGIDPGFKTTPLCEKTPVLFTDTSHSYFSPVNYWLWNFGSGSLASGAMATHTYPVAGTYPVTLIVANSRGCKDTLNTSVTVNPLPVIVAIGDTAVCIPDAITLSASGGVAYNWSPGASLSCTACNTPNAAPTSPTSYVVIGTDANGCAAKDTVRVGIQTKTTSITSAGGDICLGQSYQLSSAASTVYSWTPASTLNDPNIPNPVATPTVTTTYTVVSKEGSCIADTHTVKVVVLPLPKVDAGGDVTIIAGRSAILTASGTGIHHVLWDSASSLSCFNCFTTSATPKITTTYFVTAFTDRNCTSTDSVTVKVLCDGSQLFIPNTFTPNGDGQNDFFFAREVGIDHIASFRIFSRWGELLFERSNMPVNDERAGWNGTYNGQILNPDVYVYVIEASCDTGEPLRMKGDVTLIR
jgi:gliding motility-associated-like protein